MTVARRSQLEAQSEAQSETQSEARCKTCSTRPCDQRAGAFSFAENENDRGAVGARRERARECVGIGRASTHTDTARDKRVTLQCGEHRIFARGAFVEELETLKPRRCERLAGNDKPETARDFLRGIVRYCRLGQEFGAFDRGNRFRDEPPVRDRIRNA